MFSVQQPKYIQNMCIPKFPFLLKRKTLAFCMRYGELSCVLSKSHRSLWGPRTKGRTGPQSPSAVPKRERERETGRGQQVRTLWADRDRIMSERAGKRDSSNKGLYGQLTGVRASKMDSSDQLNHLEIGLTTTTITNPFLQCCP